MSKVLPLACVLLCFAAAAAVFAQSPPAPSPTPGAGPAATPSLAVTEAPVSHGGSGNILIERFKQSGTTGIIQVALSVFGAGFILERFVRLRRSALAPRGLADRARDLWRTGKFDELEKLAETDPSTLSRVISFLAKRRHLPAADVSTVAQDIVSREIDGHMQKAYPVGVVATLEPLLGLMGMVLGMIDSFEKVALAGALGNPAQLAAGISEALTTTALGIGLAIPFLAFFHYFRNKTNTFEILLEDEVADLTIEWFLDKKEVSHGPAQKA